MMFLKKKALLGNQASGNGAVAIGDPSIATGQGAVALGFENRATGLAAVALGSESQAIGDSAFAQGNKAKAVGVSAIALGESEYPDRGHVPVRIWIKASGALFRFGKGLSLLGRGGSTGCCEAGVLNTGLRLHHSAVRKSALQFWK